MPNLTDFDPDDVKHVDKILADNYVQVTPRTPNVWGYSWYQGVGVIESTGVLNVFDARRICALYVHLHLAGVRPELALRLAKLEQLAHRECLEQLNGLKTARQEVAGVHPQAAC